MREDFESYINNLPIQTLTDELREDIIERFRQEVEFMERQGKNASVPLCIW